jgi:acylphosphatase
MVKHLYIHGRVQGVGFRHHFSSQARGLGITGWVRNRRDGTVEAMIEGAPETLDTLIAWARIGPPAAQVERVDIADAEGRFPGFELMPTL